MRRIKAGNLENRLMKHAKGEIEMSATQVRAAEILLKKIRPDLKQTDHTGDVSLQFPTAIPVKLVKPK